MPTTYLLTNHLLTDHLLNGVRHQAADLIDELMGKYHQPLHRAGVKVLALVGSNPDGPSIKAGGYPALAKATVFPLKQRVRTGFDAEIEIDEAEWNQLTERAKAALIDHELCHFDLVTKDDPTTGNLIAQTDDLGRPKLKLRPGDWNCGDGFREVVARHGADAVEYVAARQVFAKADESLRVGA